MGTGAAVQVKDLGRYSRGLGRTLAQGGHGPSCTGQGGGEGWGRRGCLWVVHSSECRAPGTFPRSPVPRSPPLLVPELTLLTPEQTPTLHLHCGQEQKALLSEHPADVAGFQPGRRCQASWHSWKHTLCHAWHT